MHAACVQVVDLSAPYELFMANTIQIFRSWFICSYTASILESIGTAKNLYKQFITTL